MYYYSELSNKITLKFNIPTVFFEYPIIELEFYNVQNETSTLYNLSSINPSGLNTLVADVSDDKTIINNTNYSKKNKRIGNVLSDNITKKGNLIKDSLYLVRIHAYDSAQYWDDSLEWNDLTKEYYNDKELFYFLIIDDCYNDLYDYNIDHDIYDNFNKYDYHNYNCITDISLKNEEVE
jgi:hypothetical protein